MKKSLLLAGIVLCSCGFFPNRTKVRVVTEDGSPIAGATVKYAWSEGGDPWTGKGVEKHTMEILSDTQGAAVIISSGRVAFVTVVSNGFYPSRLVLNFDKVGKAITDVPLRKIAAPVPMLGKQAVVVLPNDSGEAEYDLLDGDLVAPLGTGKNGDLKIVWKKPERNGAQERFDAYDLVAPNQGDGFLALHIPYSDGDSPRSEFHTLYEAPAEGYIPSLKAAAAKTDHALRDIFVYYYRIRTNDPKGALYGKIVSGPLYTADDGGSALSFVYMLNPNRTRNMEPDLSHSQAPRLGHLEHTLQNSFELENK